MARIVGRVAPTCAAVAMFSLTAAAHAQVPYAGATFGCFGIACSPAPGVSTLAGTGLTYESSTFSGTATLEQMAHQSRSAVIRPVTSLDGPPATTECSRRER
jgi:hypothetical protein